MTGRLYLPPPVRTGEHRVLDAGRAHYLVKVLRTRRGEAFCCFDGLGTEYRATLVVASTRECTLEIGEPVRSAPRPEVLALVQAVVRGEAMDRLLQKATELGVTDIWCVTSMFGQVAPPRIGARLRHWHAIVASACEQSDRLWMPDLRPGGPLVECVTARSATVRSANGARTSGAPPEPARLIALQPGATVLTSDDLAGCDGFVVGPEGGFAPAEIDAFTRAGVRLRGLGATILRAETAPLAALAALRHNRGWG